MNDAIDSWRGRRHTIVADQYLQKFHRHDGVVAKRRSRAGGYSGLRKPPLETEAQVNTLGREMRDPGNYLKSEAIAKENANRRDVAVKGQHSRKGKATWRRPSKNGESGVQEGANPGGTLFCRTMERKPMSAERLRGRALLSRMAKAGIRLMTAMTRRQELFFYFGLELSNRCFVLATKELAL